MIDVLSTVWNGFPAFLLESSRIRVVIVPQLGAKIVSLFDKAHQYEWLVSPMRVPVQTSYGADFVSQDMSGWDEMFPTITSVVFDGLSLPDHGEVWSIPWKVEEGTGNNVVLSVAGTAMPYHLTRSASLATEDCLKLRYTLTHTGKNPFPYLWAAHPQFNADEQTRIVLPPEAPHVVNVIEKDANWGSAGNLHDWPRAVAADGQLWNLDRVRPAENRSCRKFYIPPTQPVAWAALNHEGLKCQLRLDWSAIDLPFLGIWVDEGLVNSRSVVAFEPSNGYYDSLERAVINKQAPVLMPGIDQTWDLSISFRDLE